LRLLDRFTRDEVSAKVWWPLALLCVVALVASVPLANRGADDARSQAAYRAALASDAAIEPLTEAGASSTELTAVLAGIAASDQTLTAVRVWNTQHVLVASSVRSDQLGSGEALNDGDIDAAVTDGRVWVLSDRLPTGDAGPVTFYAYSLINGAGTTLVTQFETVDATLLADVHQFWMWFRIVLGVAVLLLLALAALSMREPIARIGANVPFYAESVPPWLAVMDVDRAVALEHAGDRAKDRLTGLQQRLDESERLRLKAEGELQQALAALSTGGRGMPVPSQTAAPTPGATRSAGAPRQPTPEAAAAAVAAAAASAKAVKQRRAERPTPEPVAATVEPEPVVVVRDTPVVIPEPAVLPDPPAAVVEPEPDVERITVMTDDVQVTATPADAGADVPEHDTGGWPEVVILPDPEPALQGAPAAAGASSSDASAREVLDRLVEPVGDPDPMSDDASDMRARLARTAALKKPGSRERREERERGED